MRKLLRVGEDAFRTPLSGPGLRGYEVAIAAVLLGSLALIVYLPHIEHGGWYIDDWQFVATMSAAGDALGALEAVSDMTYRPGLAVSLTAFYMVGGEGQAPYLVIGAGLAALQGWLFYLVLRLLGFQLAVAGAAAAIFVVLPTIDAARLWLAAFPIQVAGCLYLLGLLAALHGLAAVHSRRAIAWHGAAALLYLAAVLTYELVAGLVAVSAILYAVRSGPRQALHRWAADLAAVGFALAILAPRASDFREAELSPGFLWDRAIQVAGEAESVFRGLMPWPEVLGGPLGLLLLLMGLLGAGVAIGRGDRDAGGLAAWAKVAAISAVFAFAGLVMLLPADPYFVPRVSGIGNRTGAFAALGAVVLLIALIVLALTGLGALLRQPRLGCAAAAALVVATGLNLAVREMNQQDAWADSWRLQQSTLASIDAAMDGRFPKDSAIVTFRQTTIILPADVPVFVYSWDLRGALQETYERTDIVGHPWVPGAACDRLGMAFPDEGDGPEGSGDYEYRRLFFVDVSGSASFRIDNRAECENELATLTA